MPSLLPDQPADTAAAAAAHLWHLTYQLAGNPGQIAPLGPRVDRWRELAAELTVLAERLRGAAVGRRAPAANTADKLHVAALRAALLEVLDKHEGDTGAYNDQPRVVGGISRFK